MIPRPLRNPADRAAGVLAAMLAASVLVAAAPVHADGDLVVKRTGLRHPTTPPVAAPSPSPGRDAVVLLPVPPPRPPRIPVELSPASTNSPVQQTNAPRTEVPGWLAKWRMWIGR